MNISVGHAGIVLGLSVAETITGWSKKVSHYQIIKKIDSY